MSAEFIKLISDLYTERFNVHMGKLVEEKIPCGIFFGFKIVPGTAAANIQMFLDTGINISCAIVLADVQANALRPLVKVPVITLEDFPRFGEENFSAKPREVFILESQEDLAFLDYFARYGIESLAPPYNDQNKYFSLVMKCLPEIYSVHEMLGSDESKKVYRAAIRARVTGKMSDYRFAPEPQYFLEGFTPTAGDVAIDGGAYDGATAKAFAACGAKVFAFEMDAANYKNCLRRIGSEYDITLENLGLSDKEREASYFSRGASSGKNPSGNLRGKFIDLDTYVERKNLPRVDYIKLDIEGAELEMLRGAAKTISRFKPKMAVSAYHRADDLWVLANYIKSLRADYQFEFRHYKIDSTEYFLDDDERALLKYFGLSWLVPTHCESVLYCR